MFDLVSQRFCFASSQASAVKRLKPANARLVSALVFMLKSLDHACDAFDLRKVPQFVVFKVSGCLQASSSSENSDWTGFAFTEP
jgi:hypothetical protein